MRIRTRLDALEQANGTSDVGDLKLLVQLLARRDAMFWPWRHHSESRLGIHQRQRDYLSGACGIASKSDGKASWKPMHESRQRLIAAGFVDALHSSGQVSSMFLTALGEATARALVGSRLFSIRESLICYVMLSTDNWTSESVLFAENLVGDPSSWDHLSEIVLPLLTAGLVTSNSDYYGRVGYRKTTRELPPDTPSVDVAVDESMDGVYIKSFNAERAALMACEPIDASEVWIPLPPTALAVYVPSEESPQVPPPKDAAMPQNIFDDLYGVKNGQ